MNVVLRHCNILLVVLLCVMCHSRLVKWPALWGWSDAGCTDNEDLNGSRSGVERAALVVWLTCKLVLVCGLVRENYCETSLLSLLGYPCIRLQPLFSTRQ